MLTIQKNILLTGSEGKPIATDIFYQQDGEYPASSIKSPATSIQHPVIIYAHGFNGFKDWANFDLIATQFAEAGFVFIKFNFSHNGTTPSSPEEFTDLEAYGNNNYTKELFDLGCVIDWAVSEDNAHAPAINKNAVALLGHSKGGTTVVVKGNEDQRVKAIASWAGVDACTTPWGKWDEAKMADWKEKGVSYTTNSRTKQEMPLYYQLHEDYIKNKDRFDIEPMLKRSTTPLLVIHGVQDTSVTTINAFHLYHWHPSAERLIVQSDHVFGRKHPWIEPTLPPVMQQVVDRTILFFDRLK